MLAVMFHAASSADFSTLAGTSTDVIFNAPLSAAYYVPAVTALGAAALVAFRGAFSITRGFLNRLYYIGASTRPCCLPGPSTCALFEVLQALPFLRSLPTHSAPRRHLEIRHLILFVYFCLSVQLFSHSSLRWVEHFCFQHFCFQHFWFHHFDFHHLYFHHLLFAISAPI